MADGTVVLTCTTCGKKLKINERHLDRVLQGRVKCPGCGLTLQPGKQAMLWDADGALGGAEMPTRKDALLKVRKAGEVAVAAFATSGVRDTIEAERLGEELFELLEKHQLKKIVLNFGNLKFMSSSVIAVLMRFKAKLEAAGGRVIACGIPPEIFKVFKIMRLDKLWDIRDTEKQALAVLSKGP